MNNSIRLLREEFISSSGPTEQWIHFYKTFKKEFTKELKSINATEIEFHKGHFDLSGFFKVNEQLYYFSFGDVRGMHYGFQKPQLMYRTAKHNKDWTGGHNQWVKVESGMCQKMDIKELA